MKFSTYLIASCVMLCTCTTAVAADQGKLLFSENFGGFTDGTEANPSTTDLVDPYYLTIDASYTQYPGWGGAGIFSAGGVCYVGTFVDPYLGETDDGYLNSPYGDYTGDITFKFRARSKNSTGTKIHMTIGSKSAEVADGFTANLTDKWQEYTGTISVKSDKAQNAMIQFSSEKGVTFFIDDIEVYRKEGKILPPQANRYSEPTATSFKANWSKNDKADGYALSVYTKEAKASDEITENFDHVDVTQNGGKLESGYEVGHSNATEPAYSQEHYQSGPNTLVFNATGDSIATPVVDGRQLQWLRFWAKPHTAKPSGSFVLKCLVDGQWQEVAKYELKHFVGGKTVMIESQLPHGTTRATVGFEKGNSNVSIDDMVIKFDSERKYVFQDKPASETKMIVDGIDLGAYDYYYHVKSKKGEELSTESNEIKVDFLPAPTVEEAADVTETSFRPMWKFPAKANGGVLYVFERKTVAQDGNVTILEENFDKVESSGTVENPELLPGQANETKMLDNYTQLPGWLGKRVALAGGMMGASGWGGMIQLPSLTLGGNNGKFSIDVTLWSKADTDLHLSFGDGKSEHRDTTSFKDAGSISKTINFAGGNDSVELRFRTTAGEKFFIDKIAVKQDLKKGDKYSMLSHNNIVVRVPADGSSPCTQVLDNLTTNGEYEYCLLAFTQQGQDINLSERSTKQPVKLKAGTGVDNINGGKTVARVRYYNLQGMGSNLPFEGVNMVVTTYSDGTQSTSKEVK